MNTDRAIVFNFVYPSAIEVINGIKEIKELYKKKLQYTFSMDMYTKHNDNDNDDEQEVTLLVVLKLVDGVQRDKKMGGRAELGLGMLKKKANSVGLIQMDDISDVTWKEDKENAAIT